MRDIFVEWELTDTLIDGFITSENLSFFSLYPYNAGNTALRVCDWVTWDLKVIIVMRSVKF